MGWPSTLTYQQVVATGVARSVRVLAHYGDLDAATALFASNPAAANDPRALSEAAERGHEAFVHLLLGYQPALAQRIAVVAKTPELTELLFRSGMNPNLPDWLRITPLHRFAEQGNIEKARIFIDHGADLEARDEELRSTPLGYAARHGRLRMVEFLLRRGASPNPPGGPQWAAPLAWATRRTHQEVVQVLTDFEQSGVLRSRALEHYEQLVADLVEAYSSGTDAAFLSVIEHFNIKRPMAWDLPPVAVRVARLRRVVQDRLGQGPQPVDTATLAAADAQLLIARSEGFDSWPELVKHVAHA